MKTYGSNTGLQNVDEFPVLVHLSFNTATNDHDQLYTWFTNHGFQHVSSAFNNSGKKVSDAFAYKDLIEASLAKIGTQTWVTAYGILADDQTIRSALQDLAHNITNAHEMEHVVVKLP